MAQVFNIPHRTVMSPLAGLGDVVGSYYQDKETEQDRAFKRAQQAKLQQAKEDEITYKLAHLDDNSFSHMVKELEYLQANGTPYQQTVANTLAAKLLTDYDTAPLEKQREQQRQYMTLFKSGLGNQPNVRAPVSRTPLHTLNTGVAPSRSQATFGGNLADEAIRAADNGFGVALPSYTEHKLLHDNLRDAPSRQIKDRLAGTNDWSFRPSGEFMSEDEFNARKAARSDPEMADLTTRIVINR